MITRQEDKTGQIRGSRVGGVAAGRFGGGTQRLRITVEELGLELLVPEVLNPVVSRDRLATALSLMVECGIIAGDRAAD